MPEFALVALSEEKNNNNTNHIRDAETQRERVRDERIKDIHIVSRREKWRSRFDAQNAKRRKKSNTRERERERPGEGGKKKRAPRSTGRKSLRPHPPSLSRFLSVCACVCVCSLTGF